MLNEKQKILNYFDTIDESKEFKILIKEKLLIILEQNEKEYLCGKREDILPSEDEFQELFEKVDKELNEMSFDSLVDKGIFSMSVNSEGNLAYGLTDFGIKIAEKLVK